MNPTMNMKRIVTIVSLLLLLPFVGRAADAKLTALTEATSLVASNWFYSAIGGGSGDSRKIQMTNLLQSLLALANFPLINEGNILYLRTNGVDSTAVRGRLDKAWLTLTGAVANAVSGDVIDIGPGRFHMLTNVVSIGHGVSLRGAGQNSSFVDVLAHANLHGAAIVPGSTSTWNGLTFVAKSNTVSQYPVGTLNTAGQKAFTNWTIGTDVKIIGETDGIYIDHTNPCATVISCSITSKFDNIVIGGTNHNIILRYASVISDPLNGTHQDVIDFNQSSVLTTLSACTANILVDHCTLIATNFVTGLVIGNNGASCNIRVYNSTIAAAGTNAPTFRSGAGTTKVYGTVDVNGVLVNDAGLTVEGFSTIPFSTYTYAGTNVLIDCSQGSSFRLLLTNAAMGLKFTNGVDGQEMLIALHQDGTGSRTANFLANTGGAMTNNIEYGESATSPITLTTNQFKRDYLKFLFETSNLATNSAKSNWVYMGILYKYPNP